LLDKLQIGQKSKGVIFNEALGQTKQPKVSSYLLFVLLLVDLPAEQKEKLPTCKCFATFWCNKGTLQVEQECCCNLNRF